MAHGDLMMVAITTAAERDAAVETAGWASNPVITPFHPGEPSCDIWLAAGHLLEAGHAAWRVTAHRGHDCLAGLEGERPRTVEETDQSVRA